MSHLVRVSDATHARLVDMKRGSDTLDIVIKRLIAAEDTLETTIRKEQNARTHEFTVRER